MRRSDGQSAGLDRRAETNRFDNVHPRQVIERATHLAEGKDDKPPRISKSLVQTLSRAKAAHENGLEAFTYFGLAALAAVVTGADKGDVNMSSLATTFLGARALYNLAYIAGSNQVIAGIRSLCYFVGLGCTLVMFNQAAVAYAAKL